MGWYMASSYEPVLAMQVSEEQTPVQRRLRVCLVGGKRIVRRAMEQFLESRNIIVASSHEDVDELKPALIANHAEQFDVIVLSLSGVGPFKTFHCIRETLVDVENQPRLVVLSDKANRGQIYTALRIGAKAYINEDADPEELIRAIEMAALNKVYLSPDAAELLVSDISSAVQTPGPRLPSVELSRREMEIVQLLCEGLSSKEIARRLHISAKTVENHRYNIYRKCDVESIAGLIRHAVQRGIVTL